MRSNKCYTVGLSGRVLSTPITGTTWTPEASGVHDDLYAISCPAALRCYADGPLGTIIATVNGGLSWRNESVPSNIILNQIDCPSASTCYALGRDISKCSFPLCPSPRFPGGLGNVFLSTNDGGDHWSRRQPGVAKFLTGLACPGRERCIAVGNSGYVRLTTNGGKTWVTRSSPTGSPPLANVRCPSIQVCYASGYYGIYRTSDVGKTWANVVPKRFREAGDAPMACTDVRTCVIGGVAGFYETTDAGQRWSLSKPNGFFDINSLSCYSGFHCVGVGNWGRRYATLDGRTWRDLSSGFRDDAFSVDCSSGTTCRVIGDAGMYLTSDAGKSWISRPVPPKDRLPEPLQASCPSARSCYIVNFWSNTGTVLVTHDSGGTWSLDKTVASRAGKPISGISCPSDGTCYADGTGCFSDQPPGACSAPDGHGAIIIKTTDGGASWKIIAVFPRPHERGPGLQTIECPSVTICYATGSSSVVFKTEDAGKTWTRLRVPGYYELDYPTCSSTRSCSIVAQGCNGGAGKCGTVPVTTILTTSDGGATWQRHSIWIPEKVWNDPSFCYKRVCTESAALTSRVSCSKSACYAVGLDDSIVRTTDNWKTHEIESSPGDAYTWLFGIACAGVDTCYTVGVGGTVLRNRSTS